MEVLMKKVILLCSMIVILSPIYGFAQMGGGMMGGGMMGGGMMGGGMMGGGMMGDDMWNGQNGRDGDTMMDDQGVRQRQRRRTYPRALGPDDKLNDYNGQKQGYSGNPRE
jgi:hypothetical protein